MTRNPSATQTDDGRDQAIGTLEVVGYRWTCPFCGTSRSNPAGEEADEGNAVTALRSHVRASDGDGHGPSSAYPDGFDPATFDEHVVGVDRRGEPVESGR